MRKNGLLAAIGMTGVVAAAASCGSSSPAATPPPAPAISADESVRRYLGEAGGANGLWAWEQKVAKAICQLENQNPAGLNPAKRVCVQGNTDPPIAPKYPPPEG